jgi:hypothetical protein
MMRIPAAIIAIVAVVVLAAPAMAARHQKHAASETGPLIMSGTMVPAASPRRLRVPEVCKPVVIKRRPMLSTSVR